MRWFTLTCLLLAGAAPAQQVPIPNPSFETGQDQPASWTLSGAGHWSARDAAEGSRAIAVQGDGQRTGFWRSGALPLLPSTPYLLRFQARSRARGGTPISGPVFCNRDLGDIGSGWSAHTSVFFTPASLDPERSWLRFGQWQISGQVEFDQLWLAAAQPVYAEKDQVVLGEGERLDGLRYAFVAPFHTPSRNHSRPLARHACDFNTNRWVFGADSQVIYCHEIAGHPQREAAVEVAVGYYRSGELAVEAGADGEHWRELGSLSGSGNRKYPLPADLLPSPAIWVRLRARARQTVGADSDPGAFQVNAYAYRATLEGAPLRLEGSTRFVAIQETDPRLRVEIIGLGEQVPGGDNRIEARIENLADTPLVLRSAVRVSGEGRTEECSPGETVFPPGPGTLRLAYDLPGDGAFWVECSLGTFRAATGISLAPLFATRYGQILPGSSQDVGLWWASSGWKVSQRRPLPAAQGEALLIRAARDEREAAQLVVRPTRELKGLRATAGPLAGPGGAILPAAHLLRVGYVEVQQPTDLSGQAAAWPDPLPPLRQPVDVPAGVNQPLWVRVHIPPDAVAGLYTGNIHLEAEDFRAEVPLRVEVYDFQLPRRLSCTTAFGFSPEEVFRYQKLTDPAQRRTVIEKYLENFSAHRVSPYDPAPLDPFVVNWSAALQPEFSWDAWDAAMSRAIDTLGFNSFRLPMQGLGRGTYQDRSEPQLQGFGERTPQYRAGMSAYLQGLERHLQEKGWLDEAYVYWFDEPEPKDYDFVMNGFAKLRAHAPGIRRMLTEQVEPDLAGGPTVWCPLITEYDSTVAQARRQQGEVFWWYVCTVPKAPYPGLFIDHPAIELRVWLWQTWKHRVQGVLVWHTNYWTSSAAYPDAPQNPYADPMSWVSEYSTARGNKEPWGNGDGRFLYPPEAAADGRPQEPVLDGPVDSIRWEMLRDGLEDYEYFAILQRLLEERGATLAEEERRQCAALLQVPEDVAVDLTRFTRDPSPLDAHRHALARTIERLSR